MVAALTDRLFALERRLAEYPGNDADSLANKRLLMREAFRDFGDDRYQEGYTDGMRDTSETRLLADKLAGKKEGDHD
jgi:hypothetical protein